MNEDGQRFGAIWYGRFGVWVLCPLGQHLMAAEERVGVWGSTLAEAIEAGQRGQWMLMDSLAMMLLRGEG